MRLIAKRYIDLYAPGSEIPAGHYSEGTLRDLLQKGHVIVVDEEPAVAAELSPEQAEVEARREEAVKAFAKPTADGRPLTAASTTADDRPLTVAEGQPVGLVVERIPEAESDTVTRVYDGGDEDKSPAARAEALEEVAGEPETAAKVAKRASPKK